MLDKDLSNCSSSDSDKRLTNFDEKIEFYPNERSQFLVEIDERCWEKNEIGKNGID